LWGGVAQGRDAHADADHRRRAGPHGVTVNNIALGAVETPMDAKIKEDPDQYGSLLSEIPLGRMGKPEEVAALAVPGLRRGRLRH
jgi:NAD(P)-dependent dehydrogenase (short-subunit alcohol dehydrogenase family)